MIGGLIERIRLFQRTHGAEVSRYYVVGVINTAFGFGLYSALCFIGLNLYLAQLIATPCGVIFNYFSYSRHVFRTTRARPLAFMGSYAVNYLMGLALLAAAHHFIKSPYLAGFVALLIVTSLNYLVLKRLVFTPKQTP